MPDITQWTKVPPGASVSSTTRASCPVVAAVVAPPPPPPEDEQAASAASGSASSARCNRRRVHMFTSLRRARGRWRRDAGDLLTVAGQQRRQQAADAAGTE